MKINQSKILEDDYLKKLSILPDALNYIMNQLSKPDDLSAGSILEFSGDLVDFGNVLTGDIFSDHEFNSMEDASRLFTKAVAIVELCYYRNTDPFVPYLLAGVSYLVRLQYDNIETKDINGKSVITKHSKGFYEFEVLKGFKDEEFVLDQLLLLFGLQSVIEGSQFRIQTVMSAKKILSNVYFLGRLWNR